jgi:N-methylhydantoinase B
MDTILKLTAFSPVIAEGNDRASGIFHPIRGGVITQGEDGLPGFVGNMQFAVQHVLSTVDELADGDVVIVNDPYECGTHLMDMKLVAPVFADGVLVAFVSNTGHWPDVGGSVPGGFSARATEIYQEGVRIPPLKLIERGHLNRALRELMITNMRIPEERLGDLDAQLNALEKGRQRVVEIVQRFGLETVRRGIDELADRCEQAMRHRLRQLPEGRYEFEDFLDNDGIDDTPLTIKLAVVIRDGTILFDFTGSSPRCRGPMNNPASNTKSACFVALKHAFPDIPINEGALRPVEFRIPADSFLCARFPSPTSGSSAEVCQRIIDACFGAFAQAFPNQSYAQAFSTSANLGIGGLDPATDRRYVLYIYLGGGLGASVKGDGLSNSTATHSTARVAPMEIIERAYPFRVRRYALRRNSGGPGRFRGGLGIVLELELLRGEAVASVVADRTRQGPRGAQGGGDGSPAKFSFVCRNQLHVPAFGGKDQDIKLSPGDRIIIETPGGGGWGASSERARASIEADIARGYYDSATAKALFPRTLA